MMEDKLPEAVVPGRLAQVCVIVVCFGGTSGGIRIQSDSSVRLHVNNEVKRV